MDMKFIQIPVFHKQVKTDEIINLGNVCRMYHCRKHTNDEDITTITFVDGDSITVPPEAKQKILRFLQVE
jgi:hypothetical protein